MGGDEEDANSAGGYGNENERGNDASHSEDSCENCGRRIVESPPSIW